VCVEATRFATLAPDIAAGNEITAEFVDLTDVLGKTRQRSRTQVKFGQLVLSSPSQGPKTALVAVKYTSPTLAAREYGAMTAFNASSLGGEGDVTFTPQGFMRGQDGKVGLVTSYKMDALTADTILWEEGRSEQQIAAALSHAALSAAELHISGKTHGDFQPKNVAVTLSGNWYTDLEGAAEFTPVLGAYDADTRRRVAEDLHTFLNYRGTTSPESIVAEYFTVPYLNSIAMSDLPEGIAPSYDAIMMMVREPQHAR